MTFVQSSRSKLKKRDFTLDPRTKLLMLLAVSLLSFLINDLYLLLSLFGTMLIIALIARIDYRQFIRYVKPTLWLLPSIFVIQLAFASSSSGDFIDIFVEFGPLTNLVGINNHIISINIESLINATNSCLRIVNLAIGSCLFSLTTNSNDYLQSLTKIGLPFELAFTTGLVIYFLPMVVSETNEMRMSLETRGVSINRGSIIKRIRSFSVLATSILMNFIEKSKYQTIALESRAFNTDKKRTYYRKIKFSIIDVFITILILAAIAGICYLFREELKLFFSRFWINNT
ncbi:MAG: energy-coupling factor transporter transmembrane protein EcfT [Candidatus Heimdallarchaeota archaeon]